MAIRIGDGFLGVSARFDAPQNHRVEIALMGYDLTSSVPECSALALYRNRVLFNSNILLEAGSQSAVAFGEGNMQVKNRLETNHARSTGVSQRVAARIAACVLIMMAPVLALATRLPDDTDRTEIDVVSGPATLGALADKEVKSREIAIHPKSSQEIIERPIPASVLRKLKVGGNSPTAITE